MRRIQRLNRVGAVYFAPRRRRRDETDNLMGAAAVLLAWTAATASADYKEAPMLAAMVAAGELPPVEERLPLDARRV